MVNFAKDFISLPFRGGIDTLRERTMLDLGDFSTIQNMRARHPGFEQRKGQIEQNTTADASTETMTVYQFSKGRITEIKLYRQLVDGSVQLATNNPPTVTSGVYGSDVLTAVASAIPASWSEMDDIVLFSDGVRQHQINGGSTGQIERFIVYKGTVAIPDVPDEGSDFSREARDGDSSTVVVLDDLPTLAAFGAMFVMSKVRLNALNFTISAANGNASVLTLAYSGPSGWTNVSGQSDGTASGGATMAQTGSVSWTLPTDEEDKFQFGESGFWYRLVVSAALDAEVEVSAVTYESEFQGLQNVFDGNLPIATEAIVFDSTAKTIELERWTSGLTTTFGIAESSDGTVWLVEGTSGGGADVFHKNADGTAITSFDLSATTADVDAGQVRGIAVDPSDGSLWFVTFGTASRYFVFNTDTSGTLVTKIAASVFATATTELIAISVATGGNLWILSSVADTLYETNSSGTLQNSWTIANIATGLFTGDSTYGVAIETGDKALTLCGKDSTTTHRFIIDDQGDPIFVETGQSPLNGPAVELWGVSPRDSSGNFWVCEDSAGTDVWRLGPQGEYQNWSPTAITLASMSSTDDFLYFGSPVRLEGGFWELLENNTNDISGGTLKAEEWRIAGWTQVSNIFDGTDHFLRSGFITWDRGTTATKRQFRDSTAFLYWYRISTDTSILNAKGSLFTVPYFNIKDLGQFGRTNTVWDNRAIYNFDFFPVENYASAIGKPMVINGNDAGALERIGDGRLNKTIGSRKFDKDLLIWQEEKGVEGGTITKYTNSGSTLATVVKTVLSNKIGALNNKAIIVVEGVIRGEGFFKSDQTQFGTFGFSIGRDGVFATDGLTVVRISDRIQNFFDPTKDEVIRKGFEDKHWLGFDSTYNVIRMGLVSGSSASIPNKFFVYDLRDKAWMIDTPTQALSFVTDIEAASGDVPVLSIGGGADTGKVYILNNSDDDVSTAIDADVIMELGREGHRVRFLREILMLKSQTAGDVTRTIAQNGNTSFGDSKTFSMVAETSGDVMRRHIYAPKEPVAEHLSIRWRNNEVSEKMYLEKFNAMIEFTDGTQ